MLRTTSRYGSMDSCDRAAYLDCKNIQSIVAKSIQSFPTIHALLARGFIISQSTMSHRPDLTSNPSTAILIPGGHSMVSFRSFEEFDSGYSSSPTTTSSEPPVKSQNIPIRNPVPRTPSEVQLCQDEAIAEERDYAFFSRLVVGISHSAGKVCTTGRLRSENETCLANILTTRHRRSLSNDNQYPPHEDSSWNSQVVQGKRWHMPLEDQPVETLVSMIALSTDSDDKEIFDLEM